MSFDILQPSARHNRYASLTRTARQVTGLTLSSRTASGRARVVELIASRMGRCLRGVTSPVYLFACLDCCVLHAAHPDTCRGPDAGRTASWRVRPGRCHHAPGDHARWRPDRVPGFRAPGRLRADQRSLGTHCGCALPSGLEGQPRAGGVQAAWRRAREGRWPRHMSVRTRALN